MIESTGGTEQCLVWVPKDWVGVEVVPWIEPEYELLFSIALPLRENVGAKFVGLSGDISDEFKVYFVPWCIPFGLQLQSCSGQY